MNARRSNAEHERYFFLLFAISFEEQFEGIQKLRDALGVIKASHTQHYLFASVSLPELVNQRLFLSARILEAREVYSHWKSSHVNNAIPKNNFAKPVIHAEKSEHRVEEISCVAVGVKAY